MNSLGAAKVCVGTPEVLNILADAEDATSKLVIVGINRVSEASDLPTRERRDLAGLADSLDELVPA